MRRAASTPPELPGYTPDRLLGSGGFADVFLYEQRLPRRKVAVKVLLDEGLERDTKAQFVAEANLMAQLSAHPYIVSIFHADVAPDGRPYFVMEYCSGPSLSEQYKRAPFGVTDALRTGIRLSSAVATAHAAGILHRDIKPANVLTNDYGWPALTDFGISSTLEGELPVHTVTGVTSSSDTSSSGQSAVGMSVPWSPSEMFTDDPRADARSDVFSLAATVHTLVAGRTPFEIPGRPNGALDLIGRIERGAITPIRRDDVPRSLEHVLAKGLAVAREDRYPSAVEFARALQRVELELGYAATTIEVPNVVETEESSGGIWRRSESDDDGDADATRARSVRVVAAQPAAPSTTIDPAQHDEVNGDDATQIRGARSIDAQPPAAAAASSSTSTSLDDHTVARPRRTPPHDGLAPAGSTSASASGDQTVMRPRTMAASPTIEAASAHSTLEPVRRSRRGLIVGLVAGALVAAAIAVAVVVSGSIDTGVEPQPIATPGENAIIEATVPAPDVSAGARSADGSVVFTVSHEPVEDGDRYRWVLADGSDSPHVADGPDITVTGVDAGQRLCIDVQVQRGSKTSELVTGCTP